jgi:hypothetical protein
MPEHVSSKTRAIREESSNKNMAQVKTTTPSPAATNALDLFSKLDPMADNFEQALKDAEKAMLESVKGWAREQVGFPPYWAPLREDAMFFGRIVALDTRQDNFHRYVVQATKFPMFCRLGPADDAEKIMVPTGDFFTVSSYAGLPLDDFFDIEVCVRATKKRKLPGNEASEGVKRDLWMWEVKVEPKDQEMIRGRRLEKAKELQKARELTEASES